MIEVLALFSTAILFGGMTLYSFGFAPLIFHALGQAEAGKVLRIAFPWYYLFIIMSSIFCGVLLITSRPDCSMIMLGIALIAIYTRQVLIKKINQARDNQLASASTSGRRFALLHSFSVALNFLQLIATGYVLSRFTSVF